jgi:hypothetical protein
MVTKNHTGSVNSLAHEQERGATLFIVLMILMILTAIGTFAASNARFETQTAGFERQRTVTHEVVSFGAYTAMQEVGTKAGAYADLVKVAGSYDPSKRETCAANAGLGSTTSPFPCYHLYMKDVENSSAFAGGLISPPDPTTSMPGTLGLGTISGSGAKSGMNGGYVAEITELYESVRPIAGYPTEGPGSPVFYDFTVTSNGFVFYDTDLNGIIDPLERGGSTYGSGRGHVIVGPIMRK